MTSIQFRVKSVQRHMQKHFPNCPEIHLAEIVQRVTDRAWEDTTIGAAVGIIVTNYIRHRLTDYEMLMKRHGLTREEARLAEAGAVSDIRRSWQRGAVQPVAELSMSCLRREGKLNFRSKEPKVSDYDK